MIPDPTYYSDWKLWAADVAQADRLRLQGSVNVNLAPFASSNSPKSNTNGMLIWRNDWTAPGVSLATGGWTEVPLWLGTATGAGASAGYAIVSIGGNRYKLELLAT